MSPKVRLRKIPIIMYSFLLYLSPLYLSSRIFLPAEVSLSMGGCGSAYTEKAGRSPPSPRDFPLFLQGSSCKTYLQGGSPPLPPGSISYREEMDERRARNLLVP